MEKQLSSECGPWERASSIWSGTDIVSAASRPVTEEAPATATTATVNSQPSVSRQKSPVDEDAEDAAHELFAVERKKMRRLLRGRKIYFEEHVRDVVFIIGTELGMSRENYDMDKADFVWVEAQPLAVQTVIQLKPHQRVNFFPGMKLLATKSEFARLFNRFKTLFGEEEFAFVPQTFLIPGDEKALSELANVVKKKKKNLPVYVVKPSSGCGGDGIYLTSDPTAVRHSECVVQEYITNPLLLGGKKFDFRIYVLISSINPVRFYVCREGLCRMAVEPYERADKSNFHKLNMHLTNYSLNKFASTFVANEDAARDDECSKRCLTTAFYQLHEEYPNFDASVFWSDIYEIVEKIIAALMPQVLLTCGEHTTGESTGVAAKCFQLLGIDILLDDQMHPHLLEINHHPSLQTDAPIDVRVKSEVIRPLLAMMSYDTVTKHSPSAVTCSRADWEDQHRGLFMPAGSLSPKTIQLVQPFLVIKDAFLDCCRVGQTFTEMNASRFRKLARNLSLVYCEGAKLKSVDLDLILVKKQKRSLDFQDLTGLLLEEVGNFLCPETPPQSLQRLHGVVACIRQCGAAE